MDTFINLAQQGLQAYQSHSGGQQEGHQQGPPPHQQQQHQQQQHQQHQQQQQQYNYEGGEVQDRRYRDEDNYQGPNLDHDDVVNQAAGHSEGSGDSNLFSKAMQHISHNKAEHTQPIDQQGLQEAHQQAYERSNAGSLDSGSMGAAAAMQALKMFTQSGGGGGGGGTSNLVSMAMAEASKLFESSGGSSSGNKQEVVNGAAMTMMKLVVQSKFGGGIMGGGNSGGLGSLMSVAGKFL